MNTIGDTITLGSSDLRVAPLGVGAWSWGDIMIWGYGHGYGKMADVGRFATNEDPTPFFLRYP